VEYERINDTGNNTGDCSHYKITQTIPEQHTRKVRTYGPTNDSHTGHCPRTAESAGIKVQNICQGRNNITFNTNCKQ
jgi:hypothetical protein